MEPVAHLKNATIPDDVVAVAARTEQALSRLPTGPEQIAEFLRGHGIRGTQCFSTSCPIANWLKREVPELAASTSVAVTPLIAEVAHQVEVEMPPVVTDFIVAFDAGDYDFLLDDGRNRVGHDAAPTTSLGEIV
jgi:hypothetical protein